MKGFLGLVLCFVVGSVVSEEIDYTSNYSCYLYKVFAYRLNADYSGGWCKFEPKIVKYQIQAAEECKTGFTNEARKYYESLNKVCNEHLVKDLDGNCGIEMFTDIGKDCLEEYYAKMKESGVNPFDPVASEKVLCKYFDTMMACRFKEVEEKCKKDYSVFLRVMEPYMDLQHKTCAILPASS